MCDSLREMPLAIKHNMCDSLQKTCTNACQQHMKNTLWREDVYK